MAEINVKNEIGQLKEVLVHRPGNELLNLTPEKLHDLLFDDIPYLKIAQKEHDKFVTVLKNNGVRVYYLEDLMAETLNFNPNIKEQFLKQFIKEAGVYTPKYRDLVFDYLINIVDNKKFVLKTMEGVQIYELDQNKRINDKSLVDLITDESEFILEPMPNLYFTRDPFASIGEGIAINKMASNTRFRETIYSEYIFSYHPKFKNKVEKYYQRYNKWHIEGGDILNLNDHILAIGISERTEAGAIDCLARNLFKNPNCNIDIVLAFNIPKIRSFMHLDTVFTQVDFDKFVYHPGIMAALKVFEITESHDSDSTEDLNVLELNDSLENILNRYLDIKSILIPCANSDSIASKREQWNDGTNTLCIAPKKVIVYDRNNITNEVLKSYGIEVIEIPESELSRGRGGPRCMSMPLVREKVPK